MGLTSMHVEAKIVIAVVIQTHPQSQLQFLHSQNYSCSWKVDLTSMFVPPIGAIHKVQTNILWILVEGL